MKPFIKKQLSVVPTSNDRIILGKMSIAFIIIFFFMAIRPQTILDNKNKISDHLKNAAAIVGMNVNKDAQTKAQGFDLALEELRHAISDHCDNEQDKNLAINQWVKTELQYIDFAQSIGWNEYAIDLCTASIIELKRHRQSGKNGCFSDETQKFSEIIPKLEKKHQKEIKAPFQGF